MKDEELMKALGRAAGAQRATDARWEALAAGRLSDAERERLLEEAAQSEEAAEAYEAFRPLGAEFRARVVARLAGELERAPQAQAPRSAKIVPFPQRVARRFVPLALAASVLVAVGLAFLLRPGATLPPLPGYGLRLNGQAALMRGEVPPAQAAPFAAGNQFRLLLTPDSNVEGEVVARAFVLAGGAVTPLAAPPPRIAGSGAVLIEGALGRDVELPGGESTLLVIVGREASFPDAQRLAQELGATGHAQTPDWSAWAIPLRVE